MRVPPLALFAPALFLLPCASLASGAETRPPDPLAVPPPPADGISPAALLYSTRIQFQGDEPMVTVALVEHEPGVTFSSGDGLWVDLGGAAGRAVFLPAGGRYQVRCRACEPGAVSYRPVVADVEYGAPEARRRLSSLWLSRGLEVDFVQVGGLFGLRGKVIDTRRYLAVAGGYMDKSAAEARAAKLLDEFGVRPFVYTDLNEHPEGILEVVELRDGAQKAQVVAVGRDVVTLRPAAGDTGEVELESVPHDPGFSDGPRSTRRYRGQVHVVVGTDGALTAVNLVSLESLLRGLVPAELFASAPTEALRAQAVVARSEVLAKIGVHHVADPYILCSSQHCQVYSGRAREHPRSDQAVSDTRGEVLVGAGDRIVSTVYSSTCGGHTEDNDVVWPQPLDPHLRARPDGAEGSGIPHSLSEEAAVRSFVESPPTGWCSQSSYARPDKLRWTRSFEAAEIDRLANERAGVGRVREIRVDGRGPGGRVRAVTLEGTDGSLTLHRELPVRRFFGNLNSGAFVVDVERDPAGQPLRFVFRGAGWGHGVGMCQIGATGMAQHGHDYRAILGHYYKGSRVVPIY